ncbi:histidine kinase [Trichormus variabilis ATCC 29413]|uniref:histidine kinase n=2 Tax=Anabaena variabilis TaxID=264691 RepID=Q3M6R0_TRIV2|nr:MULTISPECIES: ATP-binding protein [Nostocaceae]ABA23326.1 histidine kinase [Trichormus variabilis ATCC 29413]MBC1214331.1 GAF domain-containing sensor histidine kinase [Trichormus variabilis ARAD]MBC1257146.1 GAF domain-containing sensor histidine kinase [Trichormus variabilis V5]MBC1269402.1 GAF domain-containing sensor histidine kinase [Trichormus variabilis FSR]MBC1302906.1 GAF domain-containing sensor histidine kinase [Trichormus variabilis N2B]
MLTPLSKKTAISLPNQPLQQENINLKLIVEGIASQVGEAFFQACAHYLAEVLQIQYALIAEFIDDEQPRARVLAFWKGEEFGPNFEYDLAGTPCGVLYQEGLQIYPDCIQKKFPDDLDLVNLNAESYLGVPILDPQGKPLGHIAGLHIKPLERSYEEQEAILKIFAARSAAEIERQLAEKALKQQNIHLEQTLKELHKTQIQLIQAERMSSLGHLVAGIAHEINNPIGFIYSNITHTREFINILLELIVAYQLEYPNPSISLQQKIKEADIEFLQKDVAKMLKSMETGSDRIRDIVLSLRNFSRLDESSKKSIDLHEGIESTLLILQHRLQANELLPQIQIIKKYQPLPKVNCHASQINQVFMNILSNAIDALQSASNTITQPRIEIKTEVIFPENTVRISISDNGIGIDEISISHIFDPFFTTKPVGSGTGLGLSIAYQIVVEQHRGKLNCISTPGQDTKFEIEIPM